MRPAGTGAAVPILPVLLALGLAVTAGAGGRVAAPDGGTAPVHADGPPAGHTGGFGEPDCTVCHLEAGPDLPGTGALTVRGFPERYRAGERHLLEVVLEAGGTERAGFQLSVRSPSGEAAGTLHAVDGRVRILAPDSLPATYAVQTAAGSAAEDPGGARWTVAWIAPARGEATLHAAANSADGDESPLGDLVFTTRGTSRPGDAEGVRQER